MDAATAVPWVLRVAWAALPVTLGPALGAALADHSVAVGRVGALLAWAGWVVGLLAVAVPRTVGATALRTVAPAALVAGAWAAAAGPGGAEGALGALGGAVAAVVAFAPLVGDWLVNGSSYGDERRMPLRVPGALLVGPLPLTWAAVAGPVVAGPLLLAARAWVPGAVVVALGAVTVPLGVRALHGLSRRWVVFVPAGLVLHDHQAMLDPVLVPAARMARLGPAPADGDVVDLTQGAFGLALQIDLREPLEVAPRTGRGAPAIVTATALRWSPTRPGAALAEARRRRLPTP